MPRGGKRPGAGRKRKIVSEDAKTALRVDKDKATELIAALNQPVSKDESREVEYWRGLWEAPDLRIRLDTRKYLYDKRDGKPVQTINHLHDKPIQMEVNVQLSEIIREVRERKREYEKAKS